MVTWSQRVVGEPAQVVVRALPSKLRVGRDQLTIELAPGTGSGPGGLRFRASLQRARRRWAVIVEVSPLSANASAIDVGVEGARTPARADVIAAALLDYVEPAVPPAPSLPRGRRRVRLIGTAAAAAVLALAAVASHLLTPPAPVHIDAAVAEFRAGDAAGPRDTGRDREPAAAPRKNADAGRDPSAQADRRRGQRRSTRVAVAPEATIAARPERARPNREVDEADAQARGRSSPRAGRRAAHPSGPPRPEAGVYTYRTSGYEEIDKPNGRHHYPEETALTVRHTGCGFTLRWQPLEGRWDEMDVCSGEDLAQLLRLSASRQFFGQRQQDDYVCTPESLAWRSRPGMHWTSSCDDGDTVVDARGQAIGFERIRVGDAMVTALRLSLRATVSGETDGTWSAERWIDRRTGLPVRVESRTDATSESPVGTVQYHEEFTNELISMDPRR